jgi:hypothetical protein
MALLTIRVLLFLGLRRLFGLTSMNRRGPGLQEDLLDGLLPVFPGQIQGGLAILVLGLEVCPLRQKEGYHILAAVLGRPHQGGLALESF